MEAAFDRILADSFADATARQLLDAAMRHFYAFTLVLIRMSGLMLIGPVFGQSAVPANIRVLFVFAMAMLITPTLEYQSQLGFQRLDADGDGYLSREEVPAPLGSRFDRLVAESRHPHVSVLSPTEFGRPLGVPATVLDYAWVAVRELALGFLLGLGVLTIFAALQLAGHLIDQQTGIALSEVFSPGLELSASVSAQFLYLAGVTVFLVMEPVGGHLLLISALVETFQTLPVGEAFVTVSAIEFARDLVHQSLALAVQIVAPMLATMSLVALCLGTMGRSVPQVNVLVIGFAVRAMVNIFILALTFSGAMKALVDMAPQAIDRLRYLLTSLS